MSSGFMWLRESMLLYFTAFTWGKHHNPHLLTGEKKEQGLHDIQCKQVYIIMSSRKNLDLFNVQDACLYFVSSLHMQPNNAALHIFSLMVALCVAILSFKAMLFMYAVVVGKHFVFYAVPYINRYKVSKALSY